MLYTSNYRFGTVKVLDCGRLNKVSEEQSSSCPYSDDYSVDAVLARCPRVTSLSFSLYLGSRKSNSYDSSFLVPPLTAKSGSSTLYYL